MNQPAETESSAAQANGTDNNAIKPPSARIGIFRRVAVERYMRPLESNTPEMLAPQRDALLRWALLLLCAAVVVLLIA